MYPISESKRPSIDRVEKETCVEFGENLYENVFPHVLGNNVAFVAGCEKDFWVDLYVIKILKINKIKIIIF